MNGQKVFIISGGQGEGKTTLFRKVSGLLINNKKSLYGFYAKGEWEGGTRSRFFLCDLNSDASMLLCQSSPDPSFKRHGRFYFSKDAIQFGHTLLSRKIPGSIFAIDEIGRFELNGFVWADKFRELLSAEGQKLLITLSFER
ncbi:MAG: nucleoside-triphosphatase [bacterium]